MKEFRKNGKADTDYRTDSVTFMGKLHTDLRSTETSLIPGLGIRIELEYSSNEFVLQTEATDTTGKYKLEIAKARLFCPVGQMAKETFQKIERKLQKEPAKIYLDRAEVTHLNIPNNSKNPVHHLFPGAILPSKIILAILPTKTYNGSFTKNTYNFARSWGTCPTNEANVSADDTTKKGNNVAKSSVKKKELEEKGQLRDS
jgi:hypothetical protein